MLRFARILCIITALCLTASGHSQKLAVKPSKADADLRARYVIAVVDDFIVEAYHNGKHIPYQKREMAEEIHGAIVERIQIEVKKGDWLVFNVVNNRLRWGGASYFAVAGCLAENEFGFLSRDDNGLWSACDSPSDADRFITERNYLAHRPALKIATPWGEGTPKMQQYAGNAWAGDPLWGQTRNTWIKVQVE